MSSRLLIDELLIVIKPKAVLIAAGVAGVFPLDNATANVEPVVALANEYRSDLELGKYWISEKLDGVRAIWTGTQLITRRGKVIHAPEWFTEALPEYSVEGELWAGRGGFNLVQSTVLDNQPDEGAWEKIRFMLFDLPDDKRSYKERYRQLLRLNETSDSLWFSFIEHRKAVSEPELLDLLNSVIDVGGEGLMLRRYDSHYFAGRSDDLVKVKKHQDNEARVIGYKPGSGKYQGLMGSVLVRLEDGRTFYIGSGFTDEMRRNPPVVGSTITYRFNGYTSSGLPRFARFLRVRKE